MNKAKMSIDNLMKRAGEDQSLFISLLAEEIIKQRLAVFVGAGCSMSIGLPSWSALLENLMKEFNIKTHERDVFRLASRIEWELGPLKFREKIIESLRIDNYGESAFHEALIALDTFLFITTNYDTVLEDYFRLKGVSPAIITNAKDIPSIDQTRKTIIKLHGDVHSPSSLVITAQDYSKYKEEGKAFVDWLESITAQKSILFMGASFDDPRLKDVDDYVLNIFGRSRRQPFIFLKIPEKTVEKSDEDFEIEINDFEALCHGFKDRGFYVILVRKFQEIAIILSEVKKKVLETKLTTNPKDLDVQLRLKHDYTTQLENKLNDFIDQRIQELVKKVLGEGRLPGMARMRKGLDELIDFLDKPPHDLKIESQLEGLLCITDALLILAQGKDDIIKARRYYENANTVFQQFAEKQKFQERLIRIRAKLLYAEGRVDEAIDSLATSQDQKTISFLLLLMVEAGKVEEAYRFVESNNEKIQWIPEKLRIYVMKGKTAEAERLFWRVLGDFETEKEKGNIENTEYKGDYFFDHICFTMVHSLYYKAWQLTGKKELNVTEIIDFQDDVKQLLNKSLEYVDIFLRKKQGAKPEDDYRLSKALVIEMTICRLMRQFERADQAASKLVDIEPPIEEVIRYISFRNLNFPDRDSKLKTILEKLEKIHTGQSWSWLAIAIIRGVDLDDRERAWDALRRAFMLCQNNEEQNETLLLAVELACKLEKLDDLLILIKSSSHLNDDEKYFWEGYQKRQFGKFKEAVEIFNKLNESNLSVEQKAGIRRIKGENEIENKNWEEARNFLKESLELALHPATLMDLLVVLTTLQDGVEVLKIIDKFESLGIDDDQVTLIKAQAAGNLRQFDRSEAAWRKLIENNPDNPGYIFRLAHVLVLQGKENEAIKILEPFVHPDEKFDFNCLRLAVQIYSSWEDKNKAFTMLTDCYDRIQDHPELLSAHLNLGFQIGEEQKAHESLVRLQILDDKGIYPEKIFTKLQLEDAINLITKKREEDKKLKDSYMQGQIPRLHLCASIGNNYLYLDWAVRTQSMVDDFLTPEQRIGFTIYSTHSFRVNENQLVQIEAPKEAEKIVIDYHALITIHRLGFMDKLAKRYKEIAYPEVFKRLWKMEQDRYAPHQLSKVKVVKMLVQKLDRNDIKAAEAPVKDTMPDKTLSLARIEKIPLIDNYIKEDQLKDYPDVPVIRLPQVLDWIYEKGRISESEWQKAKKYSKSERIIVIENCVEIMDKSMRFVIDRFTLELAEEFEITQKLINMGAILFIDRDTADEIRRDAGNLEFVKEVAAWHKALVQEIPGNTKFVAVQPDYTKEEKELRTKLNMNLFLDAVYAPIKYCSENNGFLLTDDRWTQMISPNHFGTDVLLRDLFEKKIIDLSEYANSFLTLCKWRYRFLLPDIRVLVFLAEQYRKNLPGGDLELIASYLRKNMEDPGLSLVLEPTYPPIPIAYKYYLAVYEVWLRFLAKIWQDNELFEDKTLEKMTIWFYTYARPDFPKGIPEDRKTIIDKEFGNYITHHLFLNALESNDHMRLHNLIKISFENNFVKNEEKESALIKVIRDLKNVEIPSRSEKKEPFSEEQAKGFLILKCLEIYFGKNGGELNTLIAQMPKLVAEIEKFIKFEYRPIPEEIDNILKAFQNSSQIREDIPEYQISSLIPIKRTPSGVDLLSLHELIKHPEMEIKKRALQRIFDADFITEFTKTAIEKLKERLIQSSVTYRQAASEEAATLLLQDFQYGKDLIEKLKERNVQEWPWNVFDPILRPNMATVIFDSHPLLNENSNIEDISGQIREEMAKISELPIFLDWLLEECFFIPLGPPLNPWRFVDEFIKKGKISNKEALSLLKGWVGENNDPLAYLMGLEIVLNLRGRTEINEINEFKDKNFFAFLNQLFDVLLLERSEDAELEKPLFENIKGRWLFRTTFNRYYLKYIDLNACKPMDDDYKVMLAWWMAREFERVLIGNFSRLSLADQTQWLKENIERVERAAANEIEHLMKHRKKELSVLRYYTLVNPPTLTSLALAIINPDKNHNHAFKGLKHPTNAFLPKFINAIINALPWETMHGEENIISGQASKFHFLWELPFCISMPHFLRIYYGNHFELLGEEKVSVVIFAEAISGRDFLKDNLPILPQMEDEKKKVYGPFLLFSLESYVQLHGEMPAGASVFKDNKTLIKNIIEVINQPFDVLCFQKAVLILQKMISLGNSEWTDVFRVQLENLNYDQLLSKSDLIGYIILHHVLEVVILGYDLSILNPITRRKKDNKHIREILGRVKTALELNINRIPIENRENVRKFLNQIIDVPSKSLKE